MISTCDTPRRSGASARRLADDGLPDGVVDGYDSIFYIANDLQGRRVATFRGTESNPKETFIWHPAGVQGPAFKGGPLLRDRNATLGTNPEDWDDDAAGATRAERIYYCTDYQGNVVALVGSTGTLKEQVRYSATGVPYGIPLGDVDSDGINNSTTTGDSDYDVITAIMGGSYDVRGDLDLDGDVDSADRSIAQGRDGEVLGRDMVSIAAVGNRFVSFEGVQLVGWLQDRRSAIWIPPLLIPIAQWCAPGFLVWADYLLLRRLILPRPLTPVVPSTCEEMVAWCKANDVVVGAKLAAITTAGCSIPSISCSTSCTTNTDQQPPDAYHDPSTGGIIICNMPGHADTLYKTCRALAHELQHALDHCNGVWVEPSCNERACSEVRAVHLSGQCCLSSPYWERGNFTSYQNCVLFYAWQSLERDPNRWNAGCTRRHVEQAIGDPRCMVPGGAPCNSWPLRPNPYP